ncbi:MAG: glycosyltransferase family 4 protein [Candidatus Sulfotelmatobacter sp.]
MTAEHPAAAAAEPTRESYAQGRQPEIEIGLLTGCQDRPYVFGLAMALAAKNAAVEIVGSDEEDSPEFHEAPLRFLNLRGSVRSQSAKIKKIAGLFAYYARLLRYTAATKAPIFHILWNNRLEYFDRTLLMLYFKALGKKLALTAHNVNIARRDGNDSWLNRMTLRFQYRMVDHIFVHTEKMKSELAGEYGVREDAITVITHPVNDAFPDTDLTPAQAKQRLGLKQCDKAILFFGRLRPYKGLEYLIQAFQLLPQSSDYRLIIAGESKKGSEEYFETIQQMIGPGVAAGRILAKIEFIPDDEAEVYLKAADVLVLPYKEIFQSGVLFLGYSFGLPAIATDVGSFREAIVEGRTGFVARSCNPAELAASMEQYFSSDLYRNLGLRRAEVRDYAHEHHSWAAAAELTVKAYTKLLEPKR